MNGLSSGGATTMIECLASSMGLSGGREDDFRMGGFSRIGWEDDTIPFFFSFVPFPKVLPSTQGSDDLISNFL